MEEFLTGDVWGKVNEHLKKSKSKQIACIAYVTSIKLNLKEDDTLICDASDCAIKRGSTSAEVLKYYFDKGVKIYSSQNLHAKFLLNNDFLVIGSANLSENSELHLIESAIITGDKSVISKCQSFLFQLVNESENIDLEEIENKLEIPVEKSTKNNFKNSHVRDLQFGVSNWFMRTDELSDKLAKEVDENTKEIRSQIAKMNNVAISEIDYIYDQTKKKIQTKVGDSIIQCSPEKNLKSKIIIAPIRVIAISNFKEYPIIFFYNNNETEGMKWTKFRQKLKKHNLETKLDKNKDKKLSKKQFDILRKFW